MWFQAMTMSQRSQVLSLYRKILRMGKSWISISGRAEDTLEERCYIHHEARRLFRKNKYETSQEQIRDYIKEAETRLSLAEHYGIPYPRLMNIPQNVLAPHGESKLNKARRKALQQATPVYLKSYSDDNFPNR